MKRAQYSNSQLLLISLSSRVLALSLAIFPMGAIADTVFKCKGDRDTLLYQGTKCEQTEEIEQWHVEPYIPPPPKPESEAYYVSAKKGTGDVYRLDGEINGVAVNMVVDTGAAFLSIPSQMADQLRG